MNVKEDPKIREQVRDGYARIARGTVETRSKDESADDGCCTSGSCCGPTMDVDDLAARVGYDPEELSRLPGGANMGLSCGNPTALAELREGETVVDLGSGGGFDCFLAGPKVGASGRVIGVDMTPEMLEKARANLGDYRERTGLDNVEFRLGEIEHLPLPDASVDVLLSNCVINLSPSKQEVWNEIARVLKPGGRVAISDIALLQPLPDEVRQEVQSWVGCVAGAETVDTIRERATSAGLSEVRIEPRNEYVETLEAMGDPLYARIQSLLPDGRRPRDYVTSAEIRARRS